MNRTTLRGEDSLLLAAEPSFSTPLLRDVLLITPMRDKYEEETEKSVKQCVELGASVLTSKGISDITQHRCILAGKVLRNLGAWESIQTIVWVDSDQVFEPVDVAVLVWLSRWQNIPVSGCYVIREAAITEPAIAAVAIDEPPLPVPMMRSPYYLYLPQVYAGMGCLAVPRELFIRHAEKSIQCESRYKAGTVHYPAITFSGPVPLADGKFTWGADDTAYSELLAQATGCLPVLAPVSIGHVRRETEDRERETLWPTLDSPLCGESGERLDCLAPIPVLKG